VKLQLIFLNTKDTELAPFVAAHNTGFHFYTALEFGKQLIPFSFSFFKKSCIISSTR